MILRQEGLTLFPLSTMLTKGQLNNFRSKSSGKRQERLCNALKLVLKMSMFIQDDN